MVDLIQYLFCLVFRNRSLFLDMQSAKAPEFRKDTIYRLKNSTYINWRKFTTLLAAQIIGSSVEPLTSSSRKNAFVVDDAIFQRNGSEKDDSTPIPTKLVFVRNRSNRKDYLVLICTDTTMTEDEIIQLYGKRWDIEVFFKTCKSVLRLTTECRSLSYDAMCAQCVIVFLRYMFLAVGIREDRDLRSAGPLFCLAADELADISFVEAFEKLQLFLTKLMGSFNGTKQDICALTDKVQ